MSIITRKFVGDITYSGVRFRTLLIVEYKHTGKLYDLYVKGKRIKYTSNIDIAEGWKSVKGNVIKELSGHYYMYRIAIPNKNNKGENDIWYINNEGDTYTVHKISKYGKRIHAQLTSLIEPINN